MGGCVVDLEGVEAQMCLFIMACQLAPWKQCVCLYLIPQWGLYFHFPFLFISVRDYQLLAFLVIFGNFLLILFNFPKLLSNWGRLLPPKRLLKQQIFGHSSLINNWEVSIEDNEFDEDLNKLIVPNPMHTCSPVQVVMNLAVLMCWNVTMKTMMYGLSPQAVSLLISLTH